LGVALFKQGKLDEAIAAFLQAIQLDPKYVAAYNNLGNALKEQGKLEDAIAAYRQVIQLDPKLAAGYSNLGIALKEQGKLEEAIIAYRQAIELDPKYVAAYNNLGVVLSDQGKLEEAIAAFRQAIELDPKYANAYNNLGIALKEQGKIEEAIAAYRQAIQLDPKNPGVYNGLGIALYDARKIEEAIAAYRQAIQFDSKNPGVYNNLGLALKEQGKLDEAETAYKQALALPDYKSVNPTTAHTAAHNNLGILLQQQGKLDAAIAEFEQAIAIDPNFVYTRNNLEEAKRQLKIKLDALAETMDDRKWLPQNDPYVPLLRPVVLVTAKFYSQKRQGTETGTGLIIQRQDNRLLIITNRHVIFEQESGKKGQDIQVEFYSQPPEGKVRLRRNAKLLAMTNPEDDIDLAVLEVDSSTPLPEDIQPLQFATEAVVRGMEVRAIGHPVSGIPWSPETVEINSYNNQQFQITKADNISAGYSGGPVINAQNQVVGILVETDGKRAFAYPMPVITAKLRTLGILAK